MSVIIDLATELAMASLPILEKIAVAAALVAALCIPMLCFWASVKSVRSFNNFSASWYPLEEASAMSVNVATPAEVFTAPAVVFSNVEPKPKPVKNAGASSPSSTAVKLIRPPTF